MKILTSRYIHFNVKYYDINMAGPTLLKYLYDIDLTNIENKERRNIEYGLLIKQNKLQILPSILQNYIKLLAIELNAIIYTTDSIITLKSIKDSKLALSSCFTFKKSWTANILVITKKYDGYVCKLSNGDIIIKGQYKKLLPEKAISKLLDLRFNFKNWLLIFKEWFKNSKNEDLLIDYKYLFVDSGLIEIENINLLNTYKLQKEIYWRYLMNIIYPLHKI